MKNLEFKKIDENIILILNIWELNEENYINLIKIEKEFSEKGIQYIDISVSIQDMENIKFLLNNGYYFKTRNFDRYILEKECFRVKSWRISLTENCNYACFFCYEEGLDMTKTRDNPKTLEDIYDLIKYGIDNHYTDITFTGGEPLLKWKDIIYYLDRLECENLFPDITIVTNGVCVNDILLDRIEKYNGKIKFNFSMHSLTKTNYLKIVRAKNKKEDNFDIVLNNIKKIKARNIEIKLNFVLLKGLNTSKEEIQAILNFAYENKIDYIKFLELLITDKLISLYGYYYKLSSLYEDWKEEFKILGKQPRREVYKYRDRVKIELQQCTCSAGCSNCLLNRDINITAELKYYPCFILSDKNYLVNSKNLLSEIEKGNHMITQFGKEYGNGNPLLIKNKKYINQKIEFYYISKLNSNFGNFISILEKNGYKKSEKRDFKEEYFIPNSPSEKWLNFEMVYKAFLNTYTNEYIETIQERNIFTSKEDIGFKITFLNRLFGEKPRQFKNLKDYEEFLAKLDFKPYLSLSWETLTFSKGNSNISLGYNKEYDKITFMTQDTVFEDIEMKKLLKLEPLSISPQKYLLN
ncbi:radical SAM protein [Fusobacterium sp.]|uniref:radical SAM protein n=1 Tax=Fusobacterium sp. TaxID=68766 RepID=UPI0025B96AFD|nr:radical SAM protein [Fusobacterium sp.]